jgi:hypothetical protein
MESRSGNARWRGPLVCPNATHAKERKHVSQDQEAAGSRPARLGTLSAAPAAAQDLGPSTQAFVDGLRRSRPIYTLAPDAARAVLSDVQKSTKVTLPEVAREDRVLQVGPDRTTNIRMVSPAGASGKLPGTPAVRAAVAQAIGYLRYVFADR